MENVINNEPEQPLDIEEDPFEILERHNLLHLFDELSFRRKWARIFKGLKQPVTSGENKWARLQLLRLLAPFAAIVVPVLMLFLIALLAQFTPRSTQSFQVTVVDPTPIEELDAFDEPEIQPLEPPDPIDIQVEVVTDVAAVPTEVAAPPADTASVQPAEFDAVAQVRSPVVMTGMMGSRNPGARGEAIQRYGGQWGEASHAALIRALRWLKENQQEDGSWVGRGTASSKPAMTGLGLLTFLAYGQTPGSEEFGPTVQSAIEYLMRTQNPDGTFQGAGAEGSFRGGVYSQAIAAYALAEAYTLTRIPMIREPMEKAIAVIIEGQRQDGGWDYQFAPTATGQHGRDRNTSVAGFQAQALKAASLSGISIPGLQESMEKAADGFKLQYPDATGHFIYGSRAGGRRASMTPVGVLCLQLLGHANSREVRGGLQTMRDWVPDWDNPDMSTVFLNLSTSGTTQPKCFFMREAQSGPDGMIYLPRC